MLLTLAKEVFLASFKLISKTASTIHQLRLMDRKTSKKEENVLSSVPSLRKPKQKAKFPKK